MRQGSWESKWKLSFVTERKNGQAPTQVLPYPESDLGWFWSRDIQILGTVVGASKQKETHMCVCSSLS